MMEKILIENPEEFVVEDKFVVVDSILEVLLEFSLRILRSL